VGVPSADLIIDSFNIYRPQRWLEAYNTINAATFSAALADGQSPYLQKAAHAQHWLFLRPSKSSGLGGPLLVGINVRFQVPDQLLLSSLSISLSTSLFKIVASIRSVSISFDRIDGALQFGDLPEFHPGPQVQDRDLARSREAAAGYHSSLQFFAADNPLVPAALSEISGSASNPAFCNDVPGFVAGAVAGSSQQVAQVSADFTFCRTLQRKTSCTMYSAS
jgi:hypothetical protein